MKEDYLNKIICGYAFSVLKTLPSDLVDCIVTSPPYWNLRDYNADGQLGMEEYFEDFIDKLITIFNECGRVLKKNGTLWVNLGDTYNGDKTGNQDLKNTGVNNSTIVKSKDINIANKSLLMIPERFAINMIDNGWCLRNQIIWHKPNQMPQSAKDRFTVDFEKVFFFTKIDKGYHFEQQLELAHGYDGRKDTEYKGGNKDVSIGKHTRWKHNKNTRIKGQPPNSMHVRREMGIPDEIYYERNVRTVWSVNTKGYSGAHFATFPEELAARMIKAGCPENGLVLDPFMGAGTTGLVARKLNRNYLGIELNLIT